MTANDYSRKIKLANPRLFASAKIQMTPDEFLRQIELAFNAGKAEIKPQYDLPEGFDALFGSLRK